MKTLALLRISAFVVLFAVISKAVGRSLFPLVSDSTLRACQAACANNDGDDLYPLGTMNHACDSRCIGLALAAAPNPGVRPSGNNRAFVLLEPMKYHVGESTKVIEVPAGFVTDYASIPRALWSAYSPHDQYSRAAIIHDYLYWTQQCTRQQADNLFAIAMIESEVTQVTREAVYLSVRAFGQTSWDDNLRERTAKLPKVVPVERKDFPPNWSWEPYRAYLTLQKVEDPAFAQADYCILGNSATVPVADRKAVLPDTGAKIVMRA